MWRNLTFLHMLNNFKFLHITDVEKSDVSPHLTRVWCGECLYICTRYAVLLKNWFCRDLRCFVAKSVLLQFTHFCVEKNWTKESICGEKMTIIRYVLSMTKVQTSWIFTTSHTPGHLFAMTTISQRLIEARNNPSFIVSIFVGHYPQSQTVVSDIDIESSRKAKKATV